MAIDPNATAGNDLGVDILARTVASGVYDGVPKVTFALRPLRAPDDTPGAVQLPAWPAAIDRYFATSRRLEIRVAQRAGDALPTPANAADPKPGSDGAPGGLAFSNWTDRAGSDPGDACEIWSAVIPDRTREAPWPDLHAGLEILAEAGRAETEDMVCVSGGEGDIALLTKIARAREAMLLAEAVDGAGAEDPTGAKGLADARRTIREAARAAADAVLMDETLPKDAEGRTPFQRMLHALDFGETVEEEAGNDAETVAQGVTALDVTAEKRKLAAAILEQAAAKCGTARAEGALQCDGTLAETAAALMAEGTCESEANGLSGADLADIYEKILRLRLRYLLAAEMGDAEFAEIKASRSRAETNENGEDADYTPPNGASEDAGANQLETKRATARTRLFGLDETPDLGRLLRTLYDVALDPEALAACLPQDDGRPVFVFLRLSPDDLCGAGDPCEHSRWSLAKIKRSGGAITHFLPATRAELILHLAAEAGIATEGRSAEAVLDQLDGIVLLGRKTAGVPNFELISADLRTAANEADQRADVMLTAAYARLTAGADSAAGKDADAWEPTALRSGGLSVVNFGCAGAFSRRSAIAACLAAAGDVDASFLDADDLMVGRLPLYGFNTEGGPIWRHLVRKRVRYGNDGFAGIDIDRSIAALYRGEERDDAQMTVDRTVPRVKDKAVPPSVDTTDGPGGGSLLLAAVPEAEMSWLGDPMGVETGLIKPVQPIRPNQDFNIDRDIDLPRRAPLPGEGVAPPDDPASDEELAPPLRFGARGRMGFACVYLGGATPDVASATETLGAVGSATVPPDSRPGRRHMRSEAVAPVGILMPRSEARTEVNAYASGRPPSFTPQTCGTVTLRSDLDAETERLTPIGPREIVRVLIPPLLPLDTAERHGVFDRDPPGWLGMPGRVRHENVPDLPEWRTRYHKRKTVRRPRDGLRGVHADAAWGGFPILRHDVGASADRHAIINAEIDDGRNWLRAAMAWSRQIEAWENGVPDTERPVQPVAPSGDAVFQSRSTSGVNLGRTVPIYPDPMAAEIVLRLRAPDADILSAGGPAQVVIAAHPASYPDLAPIAVTVRRGGVDDKPAINADPEDFVTVERTRCRRVVVTLPAGHVCELDTWCRPSMAQLRAWSEMTETIATLSQSGKLSTACVAQDTGEAIPDCGLAGLPAPSRETIDSVAADLHARLATQPMPELARVRSMSLAHAVKLPVAVPRPVPTEPNAPAILLRRVTESSDRAHEYGPALASTVSPLPKTWWTQADRDPATNAVQGGTEADLGGYLEVDLASVGTIEIFAEAIAVGGPGFDDPARARTVEEVLSGTYPTVPDEKGGRRVATDRQVYGMQVSTAGDVRHVEGRALWARISNLPASHKGNRTAFLSLHELFARPDVRGEGDEGPPDDIRIEVHPLFADTRARRVRLRFRAISRHATAFRLRPRIRNGQFDAGDALRPIEYQRDSEIFGPFVLPASERPAQPKRREAAQVIAAENKLSNGRTISVRHSIVRFWMDRPWASSGENEEFGVILWPPVTGRLRRWDFVGGLRPVRRTEHVLRPSTAETEMRDFRTDWMRIRDFDERYQIGASRFATRWGSDPAEAFPRDGWRDWIVPTEVFADFELSRYPEKNVSHRPDARVVADVPMPLPEAEEESPEGETDGPPPRQRFLNVDLLAYRPRFDVASERWYVDMTLNPAMMPSMFLQVGVVRYQEKAPRDLRLSLPATPYQTELLPKRRTEVELGEIEGERQPVLVTVRGPASPAEEGALADAQVTTRMAIRLTALRRGTSQIEREVEIEVDARPASGERGPALDHLWEGLFNVPLRMIDDPELALSISVEERAIRPTTSDGGEKRPRLDDSPRFGCKLDLPSRRVPVE